MNTHTPIRDIYFPRSACRCSDCILSHTDSHGIHQIGVYKMPNRLSRRSGRIHEARVSYMNGTPGGLAMGYITSLFPNVQGSDNRIWEI